MSEGKPKKKIYNPLVLIDNWVFQNYRNTKVGYYVGEFFNKLWDLTAGIKNLITWAPTIYKDRSWDYSSIYTILYKKIFLLRKTIVENNRHSDVGITNFWTTLSLDLIEKIQNEEYRTGHFDYIDKDFDFVPTVDKDEEGQNLYSLKTTVNFDNTHLYVEKNPSKVRILRKKHTDWDEMTTEIQSILISNLKHEQARTLLFKIISDKIESWWD
jgi:hypothetical protein